MAIGGGVYSEQGVDGVVGEGEGVGEGVPDDAIDAKRSADDGSGTYSHQRRHRRTIKECVI